MGQGSAHSLSAFWQQYAFSVGRIDFLQLDVALAAMAFGEWARFERRLTEGLACAARAAAENLTPPQQSIDDAAVAFRYERDLVSGADVTAWLERSGISAEAWMDFVARDLLRETWSVQIEEILDRYPPSPGHLEQAAKAEGICSGLFAAFEESFRGKAALAFESDPTSFDEQIHGTSSHGDVATRLVRQHRHWLEGVSAIDSRLRTVLEIKDRYVSACRRLATTASVCDLIETHRVEWITVETETLRFSSESAAREAKLCVTEDRFSLADVGALSRQAVVRGRCFLSDLSGEHYHHLLSAEPGDVVGPVSVDGRFEVIVLVARTAPALENEAVADRARSLLSEQYARRAARQHVVYRNVNSV